MAPPSQPGPSLAAVGLSLLLAISYGPKGVRSDGTGLIGWGKTLYHPTCAFACRNVVRKQQLLCTPLEEEATNHGTVHNPVATPPECFVEDPAFLKTMAFCIDTYCPLDANPPPEDLVDDYWASHLGTGTLGDYAYVPAMSFRRALEAAREDEEKAAAGGNDTEPDAESHHHRRTVRAAAALVPRQEAAGEDDGLEGLETFDVSSPLPVAAGGSEPLNVTSFVNPVDWQLQYNFMYDFETNEAGHSTMTIIIAIVAIFLPIALSVPRLIPGVVKSRAWSHLHSLAIYPAMLGRRHREPLLGVVVPTRGQELYIFIISLLNVILLLAPHVYHQPQAVFGTRDLQTLSIVGNRAGAMAMGNVAALFLFATRNSVLFHVTSWSYSTYLLLHRWLGYWAVFHTILHSFMLMAYYIEEDGYEAEFVRLYWRWGIVGTVAASALLPFSLLWVRQKLYEVFLASHIALALLFLIGYYYHIWYLYEYNWGYEIWMYVAGAIWGVDRLLRLARMAFHGSRTAIVTAVRDEDGEYLRIDVEGKVLGHGVAYLCFPTIGWRFWETHPFSVACAATSGSESGSGTGGAKDGNSSPDKTEFETAEKSVTTPQGTNKYTDSPASSLHGGRGTTTFFARVRSGVTKKLAARTSSAAAGSTMPTTRLRVLIDGPYDHSGHVTSQLARCSSILCIAGGVGITPCLQYLGLGLVQGRDGNAGKNDNGNKPGKLFWSVRREGLPTELGPALAALPSTVLVETVVGRRLELDAILEREMATTTTAGGDGLLGIVVCGPPGMADHVRRKVVETAKQPMTRPYVLLDEAFSW